MTRIAVGTAPGSPAPIEIANTETGSLLRLARKVDPRVAAKNAGRRAVIDFIAELLENADVSAIVICEDDMVMRATAKNGGLVTTARRILRRAREAGIEARYPGLPEGIGNLETEACIEAAAVALSQPEVKESDNVFRDLLQAPDHTEMKAKHDAAARIRRQMLKGEYSQESFAEICGLEPREISRIVHFKLGDFSIDLLNSVLTKIEESS